MAITLYSRSHCIECNVLKRFLHDQGLKYEERNCSLYPEYLKDVEAMGYLGVPVTVIDGQSVQGLDPDEILRLLGKEK
ncbi:glutaredoxin family protein [Mechercharimyces sp. CAU 1602]|uniref:glutaredoxin family protein n=1 Tax=Mechercharimyces sp. CAU 1602 TaxID=2973933 RepID=UPI0021625431|nr:glutaredoxin family protein [Mechercharimyces sp. CAU 1602]MCS1351795.1 glutaredoxin family protein [Mechercharimyces sp. CAU 1602]